MQASSISSFQWRAFVSVLAAFSFIVLTASGAVLFISPPGRVANWTHWTIGGLSKSDWTAFHVIASLIFLLIMGFHVFFNLKPMLGYFQDRVRRSFGLRREWLACLGLTVLVFAGVKAQLPPFSSLMAWSEAFKETWDSAQTRAPEAHAELLSLEAIALRLKLTPAEVQDRLKQFGLGEFKNTQTLKELAARSGRSPQVLYAALDLRPSSAASGYVPGAGPGMMTLEQFCAVNGIEYTVALGRLQAKGYNYRAGQTLREMAQANGFEKPYELIELIKGVAP